MASALADARERWWVIGSAAVALHGADPGPIGDVDVLLSIADATAIFPALGLTARPGEADARFRSALFARWSAPPLLVELMAGLKIHDGAAWTPLRPQSRVPLGGVHVPDRSELRAILHRFGRAKDLRRAALLG